MLRSFHYRVHPRRTIHPSSPARPGPSLIERPEKRCSPPTKKARLHPASTTKIMNALLVLRLAEDSPEILEEQLRFSQRADQTRGSTAAIRAGESLAVREMLYGLLLPSGNDASVALAEHFGSRLSNVSEPDSEGRLRSIRRGHEHDGSADWNESNALHQHAWVVRRSTHDICRGLGSTRKGSNEVTSYFARLLRRANMVALSRANRATSETSLWRNTNQLLGIEGYEGIKTGTTSAAGACLVSAGTRNGRSLIAVVLGSKSSPARYADTRNLLRWAWARLEQVPD